MDPVALTVGLSWIGCGVVCILVSIPLIRGQVRRNRVYGVRFPQSFQSEEAWLAINRYGGKRLAIWSTPLIVAGLVSLSLPLQSHERLTLVFGFGPIVFIFIALFESWRFARRYRPGT